jgi:hypothetical protein
MVSYFAHHVCSSGAITRSKLEKTDPLITYENFVEELDAGDSFTTSVVDILVRVGVLLQSRTPFHGLPRKLQSDGIANQLQTEG